MRRALCLLALLAAPFTAGCEVDPFCTNCFDASEGGMGLDAGRLDGGGMDGDVTPDDTGVPTDALPDGCLEAELCNDLDDDCDGFFDEGFDLDANPEHCGECGNVCLPAHAFGVCEAGVCGLGACDVGFYDLDGDPDNGCEYRCAGVETDDAICDLRDDDCDGVVDEDVDFDGDPVNCGRCGRVCNAPHSTAACDMGTCALAACEADFWDLDGDAANGCEYACAQATPADEVCNARDDDCDGLVDEGDPGGGVACGSATGACAMGTTRCDAGRLRCDGETTPTAELCNGADDDCDGSTDEGNPEGGRVCGTSAGVCEVGMEQCTGGSLVCVGEVTGSAELCNNLDDDCDGTIDEMNPEGGASCGSSVGACSQGMLTCSAGALVCMGGVGPGSETCNGADDDCDGSTDEGNPGGGALCGTDLGVCSPGSFQCSGGSLVCVGEVTGGPEACNGQDDDCDGTVDEGNPGGGAACGSSTGACTAGMQVCRSGTLVCEGGTGPGAETCNTVDDDCDGATDEGFSLTTDVRNCGACGNTCSFANATATCASGSCAIGRCDSDFHDLDGSASNGCEYSCSFAGSEVCNGRDDDCDGVTDESLSPPSGFCNPNGVCAGTTPTCGGATGWGCVYGAAFETPESSCDTLDNDCDGFVDEAFPLVGTSCGDGLGACRTTGSYRCNASGDAVECSAPPAGMPADEACNGVDDDCDGDVDERVVDDPGTPWRDGVDASAIDTVPVDVGGGVTVQVMAYEASRADATASTSGALSEIACSRPGVRPWTSVTWDEAQAACCALNPSGTCPGAGGSGWRLCEAMDWESACEGPGGSCTWGYGGSCSMSQPLTCNGAEFDCDSSTPGDQDCLYSTGSPTFPMCYADWGADGRVYDLSGNVREWTATSRGTDLFEVRGGSFNHVEAGRSCQWSFTVSNRTFAGPNTGFRCCLY
ncbi:MAG: MopE-related protein [Myxococcota bacterium]|nr:MopE-related protein [Myxococcota bacterium]